MLTVIVKTNNSEETISETLESVKDLGEIVVIDMHSKDDTVLIAKEYKAKIIYASLLEFQDVFKKCTDEIENDWILFIEGNEIIPEQLGNDILNYVENPKKNKNAIYIPSKLFYPDKEIKSARKICLKLFKKGYAEFLNSYTTNLKPVQTGKRKLKSNFKNNKNCILKFIKDNVFSIIQKDIEEIIIQLKETENKPPKVFIRPFFEFIHLYIFKKAFLDGKIGYMYSMYRSIKTFIVQCAKLEKKISNN